MSAKRSMLKSARAPKQIAGFKTLPFDTYEENEANEMKILFRGGPWDEKQSCTHQRQLLQNEVQRTA